MDPKGFCIFWIRKVFVYLLDPKKVFVSFGSKKGFRIFGVHILAGKDTVCSSGRRKAGNESTQNQPITNTSTIECGMEAEAAATTDDDGGDGGCPWPWIVSSG